MCLLLVLHSINNTFRAPTVGSSMPLLTPRGRLVHVTNVGRTVRSVYGVNNPTLKTVLLLTFSVDLIVLLSMLKTVVTYATLLFICVPGPGRRGASTGGMLCSVQSKFGMVVHGGKID